MNKGKQQIVKRVSMDEPEDDMETMAEGVEEPEPQTITLTPLASGEHKPLLSRAQVFLLEYSHSGRGARCPECAQIIGHGDKCKLNKLIVEIEAVTK